MDLTKVKEAEALLKDLKDLKAKKKSLDYALECSQKALYGTPIVQLSINYADDHSRIITLTKDEWKLTLSPLIEDIENRIYLAEDEIKKL